MKIYPKTNEYLEGIEEFEKTLKEYKGIEIQYFAKSKSEIVDFEITKPIESLLKKYPQIEEITIHPPLCDYELEVVLLKDKNIFLNQIKEIVKLSKKYKIKINIVQHIYKKNIEEFLEKYLDKEKCKRQVYQIHFAYTANEDGYIDRRTHAIMHPDQETLNYDANLLCEYGMKDCNWVTEVSEKDYKTREDEANEIKMLSEYIEKNNI